MASLLRSEYAKVAHSCFCVAARFFPIRHRVGKRQDLATVGQTAGTGHAHSR